MNSVHTINNMCAIVFAAKLGENDCIGASIGSIFGAILKIDKIPTKWYERFNDCVHTYIKGYEVLSIEDIIDKTYNLYLINKKS